MGVHTGRACAPGLAVREGRLAAPRRLRVRRPAHTHTRGRHPPAPSPRVSTPLVAHAAASRYPSCGRCSPATLSRMPRCVTRRWSPLPTARQAPCLRAPAPAPRRTQQPLADTADAHCPGTNGTPTHTQTHHLRVRPLGVSGQLPEHLRVGCGEGAGQGRGRGHGRVWVWVCRLTPGADANAQCANCEDGKGMCSAEENQGRPVVRAGS